MFDARTGDRVERRDSVIVRPDAEPSRRAPTSPTPPATRPPHARMLLGYTLVLPSLLVFGTFIFYPFIKNFWLGLYSTPPFPGLPRRWVGSRQYRDVLTSQVFTNSFKVTLEFVAAHRSHRASCSVCGLAVLAHQRLRGIGIFRTIFSSTVVDLGRGRVADLAHVAEPADRVAELLARPRRGASRRSTTRSGRSSRSQA